MYRKLTLLLFSIVCFSQIEAQDSVNLVIPTMHENEVKDVAISPDGKFIATCSNDFSIKIWNSENGNLIRTLNGHIEEVWDVDYSPDGTKLVSIGRDGKANVWSVEDGKLLSTYKSGDYYRLNASFCIDGEHIVLSGNGALIWDWKKDSIINKYDGDKKSGYGTKTVVNPDGKSFLSYSEEIKSVSVWETNSSKLLYQFSPNAFDLLFATYNADGSKIVTVTTNGLVAVFDSRDGKTLDKLNLDLEEKYVSLMNFEINKASNELLILNYDSKAIRVVDLDTLKEKESLLLDYKNAGNGIHNMRFFPNGENFVWFGKTGEVQTGNEFGMAKVFDKKDSKLILTLGENLGIQKPLKSISSSSGRYFCEVYTNYFHVFDAKDQRIIFRKDENNYKRYWENIYVDFCKGDSILAVQNGSEIKFWQINSGNLINKVYFSRIHNFKILNDSESFFISSGKENTSINRIRNGSLIKNFPTEDLVFSDICQNEEYILTATINEIKIWNANDKSLNHTISIDKLTLDDYDVNSISVARFSPDNSKIIVGSYLSQKGYMNNNILLSIIDVKSLKLLSSTKIEGLDALVDLSFNPDGKIFIVKTKGSYSGFSQKIIEFDLEKNEIIFQRNLGKSVLLDVDWDNNRYLTTGDSKIDYHDLSSGTIILSKIATDKEYLVIDPQGRFDGSESLFSKLYLVKGLETVPLDSYFEVFYTPDLWKRLLGGESIENPDVSFNSLRPLASIGFLNPKIGKINFRGASNTALTTSDPKFNLEYTVTDNGGGISETRVFQNGKLIHEEKLIVNRKGEILVKNLLVDLTAGRNEIQITVFNTDRLEKSENVIIECSGRTDLPSRLFVLSVGINDYLKSTYDLNFAQPDAKAFYEAVNSCGTDLFMETQIDSIENGNATKANILAKLNEIKTECKQNDVFIFYYAGHGVMSETRDAKSSKYYIVPHDVTNFYDLKQLEELGISTEEILQISKGILAQKQIFILDACQSGGILEGVASRGSNEEKVLAKLARSSGTYFLTASGSDQLASEFDALGHGVFTYSLLLGLSGEADMDHDNVISVKELSIYAESKVPELSELHKGNPQYPSSYGSGSDFPLFPSEKCKTQNELKKPQGKYDGFTVEELIQIKEKAIKDEDFLKAAEIKNEIDKRKK